MTLPYGCDRQYMCYPTSGGPQSQAVGRIVGDDGYYYQTKPYNAAPLSIELACSGIHMTQPGANNGSMIYSHPKSVVVLGPDAGTSQRRSFSTYKPLDGRDMPLNPFTLQLLRGLDSGCQSSMNSVRNQELDDAHSPQVVRDEVLTIQQDVHRPQDGHAFDRDLNVQGPYTGWPNGVRANEPVLAYTNRDPIPNNVYTSDHWSGPSHPNSPESGTGYVSSRDPKGFGTDLSPNSVPKGQCFRRHHNQAVWIPLAAAIPHDFVQNRKANHCATLGAYIPSTQAEENHGNLYHLPSGQLHHIQDFFPGVHSFPQGHDLARSDSQGPRLLTPPSFMEADHSIGIPMEETGRPVFSLEPGPVKLSGRVRRPLTTHGRREAAWNRKVGVCDECRKKKIKCTHKLPPDPNMLYMKSNKKMTAKSRSSKARARRVRDSTSDRASLAVPGLTHGSSPNDFMSPGTPGSTNGHEKKPDIPRSVASIETPVDIVGPLINSDITKESLIKSSDVEKIPESPVPASFNDFQLFDDSQFDDVLEATMQYIKIL